MEDTEMYYEWDQLDELVRDIKDHISLTYRSLRHCHIDAGYDLRRFIELINEYEPDRSPKMEELRIVKKICMKKLVEEEKKEPKKEEIKKEEIKKEETKKEEMVKMEEKNIWTYAKEGNVDEVGKILANGIDPNIIDPNYGYTALMFASQYGKLECVQELVRLGADVNLQNKGGSTALMFASQYGNLECIQELVRLGADVNLQNEDGYTALMVAPYSGKVECVQELVRLGADVNIQNENKYTALMVASQCGKVECVQELVRSGG